MSLSQREPSQVSGSGNDHRSTFITNGTNEGQNTSCCHDDENDLSVPLLRPQDCSQQSDNSSEKRDKVWIAYSLGAAILFTICNAALSEISNLGLEGLLYLSPGALLCGVAFFFYKSVEEYNRTGVCWSDLKFVQNGQVQWINILCTFGFSLTYLSIQTIVMVTFSLCLMANLNAGIVSTIWAVAPLYSALLDFLIFKQKLFTSHLIGVFCLIVCAMCISLANVVGVQALENNEKPPTVEAWIPVLLAVFTPFIFAASGLQMKNMCVNRGLDAFKVNFLSYAIIGAILFGILVTRMGTPEFSQEYFIIGGIGSIINTLGLVSIGKACTIGPLGPVNALSSSSTVMFSIVQAVRLMKVPKTLEFAGMFIGLVGALVITLPDQMYSAYKTITCRREEKQADQTHDRRYNKLEDDN
eukprot:403350201